MIVVVATPPSGFVTVNVDVTLLVPDIAAAVTGTLSVPLAFSVTAPTVNSAEDEVTLTPVWNEPPADDSVRVSVAPARTDEPGETERVPVLAAVELLPPGPLLMTRLTVPETPPLALVTLIESLSYIAVAGTVTVAEMAVGVMETTLKVTADCVLSVMVAPVRKPEPLIVTGTDVAPSPTPVVPVGSEV